MRRISRATLMPKPLFATGETYITSPSIGLDLGVKGRKSDSILRPFATALDRKPMIRRTAQRGGMVVGMIVLCLLEAVLLISNGSAGGRADPQIPKLLQALRDEKAEVRGEAAQALRKMGPEAVPALIEALRDPDVKVRQAAAQALVRADQGAQSAMPALIEALRDPEGEVRAPAAFALGRMGPEAMPALKSRPCGTQIIWCAGRRLLRWGKWGRGRIWPCRR